LISTLDLDNGLGLDLTFDLVTNIDSSRGKLCDGKFIPFIQKVSYSSTHFIVYDVTFDLCRFYWTESL